MNNPHQEPAASSEHHERGLLTLYTSTYAPSPLIRKLRNFLLQTAQECRVMENVEGFTVLLALYDDATFLQFNVVQDQAKVDQQARSLCACFAQVPTANATLKESVLQQLDALCGIVSVQVPLYGEEERLASIFRRIYTVAGGLAALLLYPGMVLYHPEGRLLLSSDGQSEYTAYTPAIAGKTASRRPDPLIADSGEEARSRKARSIRQLKKLNIPHTDNLPVIALEESTRLQDKTDIIRRLAALYATCIQGELYLRSEFAHEDREKLLAEKLQELEERYGMFACFTPQEREYMQRPGLDPEVHAAYAWRYEDCAVLLWALSLMDMGNPSATCDVRTLTNILWEEDFQSLVNKSTLRETPLLLDTCDFILRCHWACRNAILNEEALPSALDAGVVFERHYTLNWLLRIDGEEDWDAITTDT